MAITYRIEQEGKHDFVIIRTDPDGSQKKVSRHGDAESAKARKIRLLSTPGMKTSSEKQNSPRNTQKEDVQVEGSNSLNKNKRRMIALGKKADTNPDTDKFHNSITKYLKGVVRGNDRKLTGYNKVQEGSSGFKRNQRVYKQLLKKGADVSGEKMASHDVRANDRAYSAIKRREKGKQMESENLDPSLTISEEFEISEGYSACKMGDGRCAVMNTGPDGKKYLVTRKKTLQGAKDHAAKLALKAKTKTVKEAFGSSLEASLFVQKNENSGKYELRKRLGEGSGDDTGGCSVVVGIFENAEKANVKLEEMVARLDEKKLNEEIESTLFLEDVVEILESNEFSDEEKEEILESFEMDLLQENFSDSELEELGQIFESNELSESEQEEFWNGLYEKRTFSKFQDRKSRPAGGHRQRIPFVRPGQKLTGADYAAGPKVGTDAAERIRKSLAGDVSKYKKITRVAESEESGNTYDTASLKDRMKISKAKLQAKKKDLEKAKDYKAPYSGTLAKLGKPVKVSEQEEFEEITEEELTVIENLLESDENSEEEKTGLIEELSEYFSELDEGSSGTKRNLRKMISVGKKYEKSRYNDKRLEKDFDNSISRKIYKDDESKRRRLK